MTPTSVADAQQRIRERVTVDPRTGCWEWTCGRFPDGYGAIRYRGRKYRAHRLSFAAFVGDIPSEALVLHHCDNRVCCNPEHLFLGSHADNTSDKVAKNRQARTKGELSGSARLTWAQVRAIRERRANGETCLGLGREFGVHPSQISRIALTRRWPD